MAKKVTHVWGIEIGQSAIKALRCYAEGDQVVADAFDFVEYPKILSQPDAEPESLLADALEQFTQRNNLRGCKVVVSVPGQQGLAKFFKPPPVEVKKIPDIVRYEAKQQIPFDLDDVIWDYQQMPGANIDDGYALESEVGLFAMKRDAVYRALQPFRNADIEADIIQLSPIAIYNMIAFDRFADRIAQESYDPDSPPRSMLILSMGTDATDLIVTNGFRMWQRSMPIGGNHFTRQLSKELKLTFAKAEHVKRNALQADDPKLVFQAMRPIFNDINSEINRSISFFRQLNKKAQIESMLLLGNSAKLPGLQAYLSKSLGMDIEVVERFSQLSGGEVLGAPSFKENQPSFGVAYGLALQGLGLGPVRTNLLPREIAVDRLVASKKPWMAAAAAALLLGLSVNYALVHAQYKKVDPTVWAPATSQVSTLSQTSNTFLAADKTQEATVALLRAIGQEVSSNSERRLLWLELLRVLNEALNRDPQAANLPPDKLPYNQRGDFHITAIDSKYLDDVSTYLTPAFMAKYQADTASRLKLIENRDAAPPPPAEEGADSLAPAPAAAADAPSEEIAGPGWVVKLEGYHYHNGVRGDERKDYVLKHMITFLENGFVELPGPDGKSLKFSVKELGIAYPLMVGEMTVTQEKLGNPRYEELGGNTLAGSGGSEYGGGGDPYGGGGGSPEKMPEVKDPETGAIVPPFFDVTKATFTVQFVWKEKTLAQRLAWKNDPAFDPNAIPPKEPKPAEQTGEAGAPATSTAMNTANR